MRKSWTTKKETLRLFKKIIKNAIFLPKIFNDKGQCIDKIARSEEWNNFVDSLIKDGLVHKRAYNWCNPF